MSGAGGLRRAPDILSRQSHRSWIGGRGGVNSERQQDEATVTDRAEDVARAAAVLAARGAELSAAQHADDVRKVKRATAAALVLAVALATVFVFANWAAERALSSSLESWRAPLVLAGGWLLVAIAAAVTLARLEPKLLRLGRPPVDPIAELAQRRAAFDEAQTGLRSALEQLAGALADAAQHEIASAMVPVEGIVDVGEDVADATEDALQFVDEATDVVETRLPGGVIVNRAFDYALIPGRAGVRAVRLVVSFGQPPDRRSGD